MNPDVLATASVGAVTDHQLTRTFASLNIAVELLDDEDGRSLIRELTRSRASVHHIWPCADRISSTFDVMFCEASSDLPGRLPWTVGKPEAALVLVMRPERAFSMTLIENCVPHSILHLPLVPNAALSALVVAWNLFRYERRLARRIEKLDENLRMMRSIERAKSILMQDRGLSEEEAYYFLRKQAMDRRASIGTLSKAIIDAQGLL